MSEFNLPPGCSANDIPGNRPEDGAWERLYEALAEVWGYGATEADVLASWQQVSTEESERLAQQEADALRLR